MVNMLYNKILILTDALDALADWIIKHIDVCRSQDLTALLLTLASVSYLPEKDEQLLKVS